MPVNVYDGLIADTFRQGHPEINLRDQSDAFLIGQTVTFGEHDYRFLGSNLGTLKGINYFHRSFQLGFGLRVGFHGQAQPMAHKPRQLLNHFDQVV